MRSHGQCIAEFLHLMGVRPIWQKGSLRVIDLEVISLDQLQRPRVDVTGLQVAYSEIVCRGN